MVQQVSFNVGTLANVQQAFRKVRDAGCEGIRPICHGNAWSVYFQDPEGNQIEMFCDTPWYVPQPLGFKIDLEKPEDELYSETEAYCRDREGFKPIEEWRAEISKKIAASLDGAKRLTQRRNDDDRKQRLSRPRLLQRRDQGEGGGVARELLGKFKVEAGGDSATSRAGRTRSRSST